MLEGAKNAAIIDNSENNEETAILTSEALLLISKNRKKPHIGAKNSLKET